MSDFFNILDFCVSEVQKCQSIDPGLKMSENRSKNVRKLTLAQKCQKIDPKMSKNSLGYQKFSDI